MRTLTLVLLTLAACSGREERAQGDEQVPTPETDAIEPDAPPFEVLDLAEQPPPTLAAAVPSPARIDVEGGVVVVELRAPARVMEGEPAIAELALSVEGGTRARPSFYSRPRDPEGRPPGFVVAFRAADGRVLSQRAGAPGTGGSGHSRGPIALPLWAYANLTRGRYTLHAETTVHIDGTDRDVAVEAPIEVTPFDAARVGPLIEALGAEAVDGAYEESRDAMDRLARVRDRRAVDQWVRIASSPHSDRRYRALTELRRWPDARALAALVRATRTRPEDLAADAHGTEAMRAAAANRLRLTAVNALCERGGEEAMRVVLAMHTDPDEQIRLSAMQCAARLPPAQARPYLERGLNDSYEVIRSEARRTLGELPP